MRNTFLILTVLAACASTNPGQLVDLAIEAQGGIDAMYAVQNAHIKSAGNFVGMDFTTIEHVRRPSDWRWDMQSAIGNFAVYMLGENHDVYYTLGGKTTRSEGDVATGPRAHAWSAMTTMLPTMLLPPAKLASAEPVDIDGVPHNAVRASFGSGVKPITYLFDPETNRIKRVYFSYFDENSLIWVTAHGDLADWREVDGLQIAHKFTMTMHDGSTMTQEMTELRFNAVDDAMLATPETVEPPEVIVREEPEARVAVYKHIGSPDVSAAIGRVMAWIGAHGGQPTGGVTTIHRKPFNYADMNANETIIHVPVQMEKAPPKGDIRIARRKAFLVAYVNFEGPPTEYMHHWGSVYAWCQKNGYVRTGARRMVALGFDQETGTMKAEIGFPVRKK